MRPTPDDGPRPDERPTGGPAAGARPVPPPPPVAWRETGRAERGDPLWITWVAFVDGRGDALYRSLVAADGGIAVSVERQPRSGGGPPRALHRGWCGLPPDGAGGVEERAAPLLAAADEAVARATGVRARRGAGAESDMG